MLRTSKINRKIFFNFTTIQSIRYNVVLATRLTARDPKTPIINRDPTSLVNLQRRYFAVLQYTVRVQLYICYIDTNSIGIRNPDRCKIQGKN